MLYVVWWHRGIGVSPWNRFTSAGYFDRSRFRSSVDPRHVVTLSLLYLGTHGSFIGFSLRVGQVPG